MKKKINKWSDDYAREWLFPNAKKKPAKKKPPKKKPPKKKPPKKKQ